MAEQEKKESYLPDEKQRKALSKIFKWLNDDLALREHPWTILNNRTVLRFWNDSVNDYNVIAPVVDPNDWVKPYTSSITRDKANTFIANIASELIYPQTIAQNDKQEIDLAVSKGLSIGLKWGFDNDGFPETSGEQKSVNEIHKTTVEGTSHVEINWVDGRPITSLIPNEEMLIPNYWQPEIQKQSRVGRIINNVTYEEAELLYGELPNWKYVKEGDYIEHLGGGLVEEFKEYRLPSVEEGMVQIIKYWWPAPPKGKRKQKYFNMVINGVLMFVPDNLMPYKHGNYPQAKGIFEILNTEFYWGNSLPNKIKEDKQFRDAWKTLIRAKGKISLIPPILAPEGAGNLVDEDIWVPGRVTTVTGDPSLLTTAPGVAKEVSQNDVAILELTDKEIDQGTAAPIIQGLSEGGRITARQILLQQANAQKLLGLFGKMRNFLVEAKGRLMVPLILQFLPKSKWKKLVSTDVTLSTGMRGTMEILFEPVKDLDEETRLRRSLELLEQETASSARGELKETTLIDPEYAMNLDLYVRVVGNPGTAPSTELQQNLTLEKAQIYRDLGMNLAGVQRMVVRAFGDNEDELVMEAPTGMAPDVAPKRVNAQSQLAQLAQMA